MKERKEQQAEAFKKAKLTIEEAFDTLKTKISKIDQHHSQHAAETAETLLMDLQLAIIFTCFHSSEPQDPKDVIASCKKAIEKATPVLEKDLGWGHYLKNLLKKLVNAVIGLFSSNPDKLYPLSRSASMQEVEKMRHELNLIRSENQNNPNNPTLSLKN